MDFRGCLRLKPLQIMTKLIEQTYNRSIQVLHRVTNANQAGIKTIYEPGYVSPFDLVQSTRFYGYVTDLRCKVNIQSIDEQALPEIGLGDSRTARVNAVRDMEWRSPRKQMNLMLRTASAGDWIEIAPISLLNRDPYYQVNLLQFLSDNVAFAVANDSAIGLQIVDAGYGLLSGNDEVVIWGSVKEELNIIPPGQRIVTHSAQYGRTVTDQSSIVLGANQDRLQATIVNTGAATVFLNYNTQAQAGLGIALVAQGGSYEINLSNPFKGSISAVCNGGESTTVTALEGQ